MTTKYAVTDEQDKKFQDRLRELEKSWRKRILDPERTIDALQLSIENRRVKAKFDHSIILADWQAFYCGLGIDCDLSGVVIPNDPGGFDRVIIMAQGITPQSAYDLCAKNFLCWKYTDDNLDKIVTSERTAKDSAYAIRVRDRVEADEGLWKRSYKDLKQQDIVGITLEEREMFELKFFKETDKHLDIKNVTLCSGSRDRDGRVPRVDWGDDRMGVSWDGADGAHSNLRSRQAVS